MHNDFAPRLIAWQKQHGRRGLPWQNTEDPYRVWLSEIMLQQTQVATVIPYYARFLERFPTLRDLAAAPVEAVMPLWSGLGYYARARNLHKCAQVVVAQYGGEFPHDPRLIAELPGIGRSTANAIASFCFGAPAPILDGNVKRVFARHFGIAGQTNSTDIERQMWALAEELMPVHDTGIYTQAQMDLGATLCTRSKPLCARCPLASTCIARREERIHELPTPRLKKTVPERESFFLILRSAQGVLLEQRPPSGIWGGLLCLPELTVQEDAGHYAKQHYGVNIRRWHELPALRHTFTHFHLTLRPLFAEVEVASRVAEENIRWLQDNEFAAGGIAGAHPHFIGPGGALSLQRLTMTDPDKQARHATRMAKKKAVIDQHIAEANIERGVFVIHTGNGKGKSSSAFGVVARALGHGQQAAVVQFIKGRSDTGEEAFFSKVPGVRWHVGGEGFTWDTQDDERDARAARAAWEIALGHLRDPAINLVVLDEFTYTLNYKWLDLDTVIAAIKARPPMQHLIITGRAAPAALIEVADTVTDMTLIKHAYNAGVTAMPGLEW